MANIPKLPKEVLVPQRNIVTLFSSAIPVQCTTCGSLVTVMETCAHECWFGIPITRFKVFCENETTLKCSDFFTMYIVTRGCFNRYMKRAHRVADKFCEES